MLAPALGAFVETLDGLVRASGPEVDVVALTDRLRPHLAWLLEQASWLDVRRRRVVDEGQPAAHLLARAHDDAWAVFSVVLPPRHSTPVHDHLTWGLVGVHEGIEEETAYERLDAGDRPGFARLRAMETTRNGPGFVSCVVPPAREIHRIHNPLGVASCSIHVYGRDIDRITRHRYEPEQDAVFEFSSAGITSRDA